MSAAAIPVAAGFLRGGPNERRRPESAPGGGAAGDQALFDALRDLDARGAAHDADQAAYRRDFLRALQQHLGLSLAQIWSLEEARSVIAIRCIASVPTAVQSDAAQGPLMLDDTGMVVQSVKRFGVYACDDIADEPVLCAMACEGIVRPGALLSLAISINGHVCSALAVQRDRKSGGWSRGDLATLRRAAVLYALRASRRARVARLLDSDREVGFQSECCCAA